MNELIKQKIERTILKWVTLISYIIIIKGRTVENWALTLRKNWINEPFPGRNEKQKSSIINRIRKSIFSAKNRKNWQRSIKT